MLLLCSLLLFPCLASLSLALYDLCRYKKQKEGEKKTVAVVLKKEREGEREERETRNRFSFFFSSSLSPLSDSPLRFSMIWNKSQKRSGINDRSLIGFPRFCPSKKKAEKKKKKLFLSLPHLFPEHKNGRKPARSLSSFSF